MRFARFTTLAGLVGLLALGVTAVATAGGAPGGPGSTCGAAAPVFAPWGDSSFYYFASNGGFESGASGWSLSGGATVVSGNEPWHVHGASDASSLLIPDGGSATATVCIGLFDPQLRFFAEGQGAQVSVTLANPGAKAAKALKVDGGSFATGASWAPSPAISTKVASATSPLGGNSVQVTISANGAAAQIDDLYVDPFVLKR